MENNDNRNTQPPNTDKNQPENVGSREDLARLIFNELHLDDHQRHLGAMWVASKDNYYRIADKILALKGIK